VGFGGHDFFAISGEPVSMPISTPHYDCFWRMISETLWNALGADAIAAREQWLQLMLLACFMTVWWSWMSFSGLGVVFWEP